MISFSLFMSYLPRFAKAWVLASLLGILFSNSKMYAQTFEYHPLVFLDSLSLKQIVTTPYPDTISVVQSDYNLMSNSSTGPNYTVKSIVALTEMLVDVKSPQVIQKQRFTYTIIYKTI